MESEPLRYITESEPSPIVPPTEPSKDSRFFDKKILGIGVVVIVVALILIKILVSPPSTFPKETILTVEKGETITGIAELLSSEGAIRFESVFKIFLSVFGGKRGLVAGDYLLEEEQNVITLAHRFSKGFYNLKRIRVTIPEGFSSSEIVVALLSDKKFSRLNVVDFERLASPKEGYLFPDTYFFLPNVTAAEVVDTMLKNYEERIKTLSSEIEAFKRSPADIVKMASIIEDEARTEESRRIIAGILWKRFDEGMPLQVDAAFAFVNGKKDSALLTLDDLKIESPYNTYTNVGLPPTAISNPGLAAIKATVTPIETKYYYYLSDKNGTMHYGATHDQHVMNKDRYLR